MQTIRLTDAEVMEVLKCITYVEMEMLEGAKLARGSASRDYFERQNKMYRELWQVVFNGGHNDEQG